MKNRNSLIIQSQILEATKEIGRDGINVTQIISKSNVPHSRLKKITNKLIETGLLVKFGSNYAITEKGIIYLKEYKKFYNFAQSFGVEL